MFNINKLQQGVFVMGFIKTLVIILIFAFTGPAFAQGGEGQHSPAGALSQGLPSAGPGDVQERSVEDEAKDLASQLALTADQQIKILEVLKEREKGIQKVREDFPVAKPGASPSQEGIAAMDKVMNGANAKIKAILNDEQKKKYETIKSGSGQGGPPSE